MIEESNPNKTNISSAIKYNMTIKSLITYMYNQNN